MPTVRIGHAPHDHHATLYIAAAKQEYFDKICGIYLKEISYKKDYQLFSGDRLLANVKISSGTGGINLVRKLDENLLDISFGGVPAMIDLIDKGSNIKIIAPVMTEGAALVVKSSIPVNSWSDFTDYARQLQRPVRIGYKVDRSVQNLIFESALREEKLSFSRDINDENSEVVVINLHGPKNLLPSLEADIIDGYVVMQPYPALAEYSRAGKIAVMLSDLPPKGQWHDHPCCALAAGEDFISKHAAVTEALVELFMYAGDYIKANPQESAHIVADWLDMPDTVEELSLPTISFLNNYNLSWDNGVHLWIKSLIGSGLVKGRVKRAFEEERVDSLIYDKAIYNRVLEKKTTDVDK